VTRASCLSLPAPCPPATYTLSLHDALPIWSRCGSCSAGSSATIRSRCPRAWSPPPRRAPCRAHNGLPSPGCFHSHHATPGVRTRSEEHTSELQSRENLVCRLLLEKKKEGVKGGLQLDPAPQHRDLEVLVRRRLPDVLLGEIVDAGLGQLPQLVGIAIPDHVARAPQ